MTPHEFINQAAHITPKSESLEADGAITIYNLGSSRVVAQYEGIEVHEAMQENAALRERVENGLVAMSIYQRDIAALRERVAALEAAVAAVRLVPNKNHSAYFVSVQDANRLHDLRATAEGGE